MMLAVFSIITALLCVPGHHCAMPLMADHNVPAMCRASLAMYNTHEEVDRLVTGLQRIHRLLG
ncbi:aminotransferase class V-fold PLP-dependent enzyme [Escherichia coli]